MDSVVLKAWAQNRWVVIELVNDIFLKQFVAKALESKTRALILILLLISIVNF
jgi:hypothetical protein